MTLENITQETCIRKIQVMQNAFVDLECMDRCLACNDKYKQECKLFKPLKNSGDVRYRFLNLYNGEK